MTANCLDDLLTLLALTVMADKRIFAEEIEVFVSTADALQKQLDIQPSLSQAEILVWFDEHRADIKGILDNKVLAATLPKLLERLQPIPQKLEILSAMKSISIADQEQHVSETALMKIAQRYWQVPAPQ